MRRVLVLSQVILAQVVDIFVHVWVKPWKEWVWYIFYQYFPKSGISQSYFELLIPILTFNLLQVRNHFDHANHFITNQTQQTPQPYQTQQTPQPTLTTINVNGKHLPISTPKTSQIGREVNIYPNQYSTCQLSAPIPQFDWTVNINTAIDGKHLPTSTPKTSQIGREVNIYPNQYCTYQLSASIPQFDCMVNIYRYRW